MLNDFKFILCLYCFSSCFCSATELRPLEEAAPFQTVSFTGLSESSRHIGFRESENQRSESFKNSTVFSVDVFGGLSSSGNITSVIVPSAIPILSHLVENQKKIKKKSLVPWKNHVIKILPSAFDINNQSETFPYKLKINLTLRGFFSEKEDTSDQEASLFLEKMNRCLKSSPIFKLTASIFGGSPEAFENLSFCLLELPNSIMLLGSEAMQKIVDNALGSLLGIFILHQLLDDESIFWPLKPPTFSMIIDSKDETVVVEDEAKRSILDMNIDASYSQSEPTGDLKNTQPLKPFLILTTPVASEKKSAPNPSPKFSLASYQISEEVSKTKRVISKESRLFPVTSQASPTE